MTNPKICDGWCVYILQCGDGSLYTGCSNSLQQRVKLHSSGKGAKYTRSHLPVKLVYCQEVANRSQALKEEIKIKSLTRLAKLTLIAKG